MTQDIVNAVNAAPHDVAALSALLTGEAIGALVHSAGESFDEDSSPRLAEALGRVLWLFDAQARAGWKPAVMKKGKVLTPAQDGPRDVRYEPVMIARVRLLTERVERGGDAMEQSALNVAFRALQTLPVEPIAALAERIFTAHGDRTGERLSLDEALFPFSEPLPPVVATLRDALVRRAEEQGWEGA